MSLYRHPCPQKQDWWSQQQYKNRTLFLSGSRDTFQKVLDAARQTRALQSIEEELNSENTPADDPQWKALDGLRDRIELQFRAALKEAFDHLVYPSINSALRSSGTDIAFAGNQSGEATIRKTLEGVKKFTTKIDEDSFRSRAEGRLFGSSDTEVVLWSDFKRNAAVNTNWPLHKPSALDDLRSDCVRRGLWREEGNHIRRGPFPPPEPTVDIRELSVEDEGNGLTYLKVEPLHATMLVFETGDSEPTTASSPVPTPAKFEAKGLRYKFRAYDPEHPDRIGPVREWTAKLRLKQQLHHRGDHYRPLYAGSNRSSFWRAGRFQRCHRELLKSRVRSGELKLLLGTDAASEGLNLQRLGTLINIDLPWNPTRLEQRKGRIQRIGQTREVIWIANLRYRGSVEDRVHEVLADRLEAIHDLFGQIPDTLEDVWVQIALDNEVDARKLIDRTTATRNPFDTKYSKVEDADWESCSLVLDPVSVDELLRSGW